MKKNTSRRSVHCSLRKCSFNNILTTGTCITYGQVKVTPVLFKDESEIGGKLWLRQMRRANCAESRKAREIRCAANKVWRLPNDRSQWWLTINRCFTQLRCCPVRALAFPSRHAYGYAFLGQSTYGIKDYVTLFIRSAAVEQRTTCCSSTKCSLQNRPRF